MIYITRSLDEKALNPMIEGLVLVVIFVSSVGGLGLLMVDSDPGEQHQSQESDKASLPPPMMRYW